MTDKSNFSDEEWELVREGPPTAGMVAAAASSGGSFRESRALAKAFTEARKQHGESELLDALVSEKPHAKRHGSARGTRGAGHSASARRCHAARTEGDSGVEPILNPGGAPQGNPPGVAEPPTVLGELESEPGRDVRGLESGSHLPVSSHATKASNQGDGTLPVLLVSTDCEPSRVAHDRDGNVGVRDSRRSACVVDDVEDPAGAGCAEEDRE
jgi:hypothetical protein